MGQDIARTASPASAAWFTRGFLLLAALWLVAQAHAGVFLGDISDAGRVPGNICWLLIVWCLARLLVDWGVRSVRTVQVSRDSLFLLAALLGFELLWQVVDVAALGLAAFFVQPVMVILGFGALHRRRVAAG
ncbi:hypothetical protein [Sandarakinorhabdus sp.]|uniref:hypothetical protein n=1 Tax=Sandarakinorhabdus sp. TaxID=1916663 RepID=UPI003F70B8D9